MAKRIFEPKPLEEILSPEPKNERKPVTWGGRSGEPKPLWAILGDEPPIEWQLEQKELSRRQSGAAPMQLAQAADTNETYGPPAPALVPMNVPGMGQVYFDPEVAPRVKDFIDRAQQAGIDVQFESGFRSTGKQKALLTDPTATTPATPGNSLHEAGRAFDISIKNDDGTPRFSDEQFRQIVDFGRQAGFNWGGGFRNPDPGHFFVEVPEGIGNRGPRIQRAQEYFRNRLEAR